MGYISREAFKYNKQSGTEQLKAALKFNIGTPCSKSRFRNEKPKMMIAHRTSMLRSFWVGMICALLKQIFPLETPR